MYIIFPYNPHLFTSLDTHLFSFPWLRNQFNYLMPHILFILRDCHSKWALKLSMRFIHSSSYAKFASLPRDTCRTDEGRRMWSAWAWQHVLPLNCQTTESKKKLTFALSVHPALFSRPLSLCWLWVRFGFAQITIRLSLRVNHRTWGCI